MSRRVNRRTYHEQSTPCRSAYCHYCPILLTAGVAMADGPRPPCESTPVPGYAEVAGPPAIGIWNEDHTHPRWQPPACTGWASKRFDLMVAVSGRFRHEDEAETILGTFGAVSRSAGVRYWSVSRNRWQDLITEASALAGPAGQRRADFSVNEMKQGRDLYFRLRNGDSGVTNYRMRVRDLAPYRVLVESENLTAVRLLMLPVFNPGDLQSVYFFERSSPGIWGYYSLTRVGHGRRRLAGVMRPRTSIAPWQCFGTSPVSPPTRTRQRSVKCDLRRKTTGIRREGKTRFYKRRAA